MKFLGEIFSRDEGFIMDLSMKRVVKNVKLMHIQPKKLRDPLSEFLLLQFFMGIYEFFILRMCQPNHIKEETIWLDKKSWRDIKDIVVGGGPFFGNNQ